jgi:hypothetical protein
MARDIYFNKARVNWYNEWHRYVQDDSKFRMIDIDSYEYCSRCRNGIAIIESTYDVGKYNKVAYITADIGTKLGIPAYIVYYTIEGVAHPTFKIAKINAILEEIDPISEGSLIELNEQEYIGYLNWLRKQHRCS